MFYQRDFIRLREHSNRLQFFSQKVTKYSEKKEIFQKFADNSSIHGFSYIFNHKLHMFERYFWAFCVLSATIITICVCATLSGSYSDRSLITVVEDSQYPVFKIDFPAIAVCTRHRINWERIQKAKNKFLPVDASNETIEIFMNFVKHLDSLEFHRFDNMEDLKDAPLNLINYVSVSDIALYLAFRCDELLIAGSCMFARQPFDCCKMFIQEKTKKGICLVFNSVISPESRQKAAGDKFYPYKNSKNGEGSGLIFMCRGNLSAPEGLKYKSGIDLMIKKTDEWTDWKTHYLRVNTNNEIILQPQLTVAHTDLQSFPISFRKCMFEHEKSKGFFIPNLNYHLLNCRTQCHQDYLIKYCNCTIPLYFNIYGITATECKPSDYICVYNYRGLFSSFKNAPNQNTTAPNGLNDILDCPCLPSCSSLFFPITMNTIPAYNLSGETMATRIDIFYQSEVMMRYLTTLKYSMWDLTSYFGGFITLFIGVSILTGVEFLHFAILEIFACHRKKALDDKLQRKQKRKISYWKK